MFKKSLMAFMLAVSLMLGATVSGAVAKEPVVSQPSLTITTTTKALVTTGDAIDLGEVLVNPIDQEETTQLDVGDLFSIVLEDNASTGYDWTHKVDKKSFKQTKRFSWIIQQDDQTVGTSSRLVYEFKALKKGSYKLKFVYERPWEKGVKPAKIVEYKVEVK